MQRYLCQCKLAFLHKWQKKRTHSFAFPIKIYLSRRLSEVVAAFKMFSISKICLIWIWGAREGGSSLNGIFTKFLRLFWHPLSQNPHSQNWTYIMPKFYLSLSLFSTKPKRESKIWANVISKTFPGMIC